jgi:hypothetical protein
MDTNTLAQVIAALHVQRQMIESPRWVELIPALGTLIVAIAGLVKMYTVAERQEKTSEIAKYAHDKADVAAIKADENAKVVDTILLDVNSSKTLATQKANDQEAIILSLTKELGELKERDRQREMDASKQSAQPIQISAITDAVTAAIKDAK